MYYEHFGLNYPPFKITPNTQLFFSGGNRGLVLEALIYAISHGEGIIKVVGEVGSGKTMLCRMLEEKLPKQVEVVYIVNPRLSPDMILHAIAFEMRLPLSPQCNRLEVMHALHTHLLEKHANNQQVVIFIEEAQGMPLETLEEIRLLSNLETTRHKLLQIVLFGQPELDTHLSVPSIRQLKERITHNFYLEILSRDNIQEYLHFRMYAVGYRGPPVFSAVAIRILTKVSKGLIRRINILADKALLAAFADDVHIIRPKHIRLAARDSGLAYPRFSFKIWGSLLMVIGGLILSLWFLPFPKNIRTWTKNNNPEMTLSPISTTINTLPSIPKPTTITIDDPLLYQRLQATEQWLAQANGQHYSIQVMQIKIDKMTYLQKFLRKLEIQPLLEKIYIYQTNINEQKFWAMMYGEFADTNEATTAMANLPTTLQRNKPFLQKIANLQKMEHVIRRLE